MTRRSICYTQAVNLLSLIIIFLALVIVGSIAYVAWEITSERVMPRSEKREPDDLDESNPPPGSGDAP